MLCCCKSRLLSQWFERDENDEKEEKRSISGEERRDINTFWTRRVRSGVRRCDITARKGGKKKVYLFLEANVL